ncbi:Os09g0260800 [Oryza sativa Japonica Group]|uniref:Os09g0260800 protein n=2 Tax=Oryza sativa subsp. japonica TaxID=39947 RepID=B9G2F2_ORYSJ|nr:hypothetical protein OsJ_28578 [Oryza sativa Japonica Group]BAT07108.1 Os09g0260800 [Oryza sativa Japonica Group]
MSRNSPSDVATEPPPAPAEAAAARRWRLLLRCRHPPARLLSPYSSSSSPAGHAASRALSLSALASFLAARRCPPPNTDILLPLRRLLTVLRSRHREMLSVIGGTGKKATPRARRGRGRFRDGEVEGARWKRGRKPLIPQRAREAFSLRRAA